MGIVAKDLHPAIVIGGNVTAHDTHREPAIDRVTRGHLGCNARGCKRVHLHPVAFKDRCRAQDIDPEAPIGIRMD